MAVNIDYYDVLGVTEDADGEQIKRAFRDLARKHHPDVTGGDDDAQEHYKRISEAYAVLSDPTKRREYDLARSGAGMWSPFATTFEDLFGSFFGGAGVGTRSRTRAQRGESVEVEMLLELREAIFGTQRTVRFQRWEPCAECAGTGCAPGSHPERCDACEGTGQVQQMRRTVLGSLVTAYPCARCRQTGWMVPDPCRGCRAAGRVLEEIEIPIEVPAGVGDGDRLRLTGEGEAGMAGGPRGDLYVRFAVAPDERFARAADDLVTWAEVPMTTASLGGRVAFESLDGEEHLEIPRGTQSGEVFRIRGRGAARRRGRGRGDLVGRVHVVTPTGLDAEQETALRRLAEVRGEQPAEGRGILATLRRVLGVED